MISGANNLYNKRKIVDDLNVFPVPDGDTGTNMSMTVISMAKTLEEHISSSVTTVASSMSFSTLRGARGNSGVILSQFFRGMAKKLKGVNECNSIEFAQALKEGVDTAYRAVMNPTEGTILTVSKEVAIGAVIASNIDDDFVEMLEKAVARGNKALIKTTDMLPALKQANVVDAGGQGWMYILEGALEFLTTGAIIEVSTAEEPPKTKVVSKLKVLNENIKYMYCTEFIIEKKNSKVNVDIFRESIKSKGDSMLVIDDDEIIKVHIHTNNPGFVLERANKLGDMINIKIDNMKHQHESILDDIDEQDEVTEHIKESVKKEFAFVSICTGNGIADIFKDLHVDTVIEGGQTMNPSTDDILTAVSKLNADTIYVLPNNKNIILAANQAKDICDKNIIVISTKSVVEGISAMLAFESNKNAEENEKRMIKAIGKVKTGQVTYAVRDTVVNGKSISEGNILGINGSDICRVGESPDDVCAMLLEDMSDEDSEFVNIYYGSEINKDTANELVEFLEEEYPELEISIKYGGQPLYYYIISVE